MTSLTDDQLLISKQGGVIAALMRVLVETKVVSRDDLIVAIQQVGKFDTSPRERAATEAVAASLIAALQAIQTKP